MQQASLGLTQSYDVVLVTSVAKVNVLQIRIRCLTEALLNKSKLLLEEKEINNKLVN